MKKTNNSQNWGSSMNPITPVGFGKYTGLQMPFSRYINYEPRDWRSSSDMLINTTLGQRWSELVTWMLSADPFVQTLIERRLNPLRSIEFVIQDENGVVDDEWTYIICKNPIFPKIIEEIQMSVFQGFSAFQFNFEKKIFAAFPIELIDYKKKSLKHSYYDQEGNYVFNDYNDLAYCEHSLKHQTVLGMFQPLTLEYISLQKHRKNWDAFGTNTAVPTRIIGYNKGSVERITQMVNGVSTEIEVNTVREEAENIAENVSPNQTVMIPFSFDKDTGKMEYQIEIKNSEQSAHTGTAYKCYEEAIRLCEERMTQLVLGATLTMFEGSSRSLGEVHGSITKEIIEADIKLVLDNLENVIKKKLNLPEGLFFGTNQTQNMPINEAEQISKIAKDNNKILTEEFFNKIGVPKEYIEEVKNKEESAFEEKEIEEKEIVKKKIPKKNKKSLVSKAINLFLEEKEDLNFDYIEELVVTKKIIQVEKKITIKPPVEKRNSRYYNLKPVNEIMEFQNKKKLIKLNYREKRNELLNLLNNGFILDNIDNMLPEGLDCVLECLKSPTETWAIELLNENLKDSAVESVFLKYYTDFVYCVKTLSDEKNIVILESKPLRSCLEVEKLRKGLLWQEI